MKRLLVLLSFLLIPGAGSARADEGRIPIAAPTIITAPGDYILTRDIQYDDDSVIVIAALHATLDLNHHVLSSSSTINDVIEIADGANFVAIRNGSINGGALDSERSRPGPSRSGWIISRSSVPPAHRKFKQEF